MHFHRPPFPSTVELVENAPLEHLRTGTRAVIEVVGYPEGQMRVTVSEISGPPRSRQIRQAGFLMFTDVNEAKDALDLLLDRVDSVAQNAAGEA